MADADSSTNIFVSAGIKKGADSRRCRRRLPRGFLAKTKEPKNSAFADLRYGGEDIISPSTIIFPATNTHTSVIIELIYFQKEAICKMSYKI